MRPSCVGARCGQRSRTISAAGAFAVDSRRRKLQHTLHARAYCCRIREKLVAQLKWLLALSELLEQGIDGALADIAARRQRGTTPAESATLGQ